MKTLKKTLSLSTCQRSHQATTDLGVNHSGMLPSCVGSFSDW